MQQTTAEEVARYRKLAREIRDQATSKVVKPELAARMISIGLQYERLADMLEEFTFASKNSRSVHHLALCRRSAHPPGVR